MATRSPKSLLTLGLLVAAATTALLAAPTAAQAATSATPAPASVSVAPPATGAAATAQPSGTSCWEDIDTGATGCYATGGETAQQAIAAATGKSVAAVPTAAGGASASSSRASAATAAASEYLITVLYSGTSYTGDSSAYYTSNANICDGVVNEFSSLSGFNDEAESVTSYNGCETTLYQNTNYGGTVYGPVTSSSTLGSFNDEASSLTATS